MRMYRVKKMPTPIAFDGSAPKSRGRTTASDHDSPVSTCRAKGHRAKELRGVVDSSYGDQTGGLTIRCATACQAAVAARYPHCKRFAQAEATFTAAPSVKNPLPKGPSYGLRKRTRFMCTLLPAGAQSISLGVSIDLAGQLLTRAVSLQESSMASNAGLALSLS